MPKKSEPPILKAIEKLYTKQSARELFRFTPSIKRRAKSNCPKMSLPT